MDMAKDCSWTPGSATQVLATTADINTWPLNTESIQHIPFGLLSSSILSTPLKKESLLSVPISPNKRRVSNQSGGSG